MTVYCTFWRVDELLMDFNLRKLFPIETDRILVVCKPTLYHLQVLKPLDVKTKFYNAEVRYPKLMHNTFVY